MRESNWQLRILDTSLVVGSALFVISCPMAWYVEMARDGPARYTALHALAYASTIFYAILHAESSEFGPTYVVIWCSAAAPIASVVMAMLGRVIWAVDNIDRARDEPTIWRHNRFRLARLATWFLLLLMSLVGFGVATMPWLWSGPWLPGVGLALANGAAILLAVGGLVRNARRPVLG
jgi:hypothetical protein